MKDFENHTSTFITPISAQYNNITLHECPSNSQGITALYTLRLLHLLQSQGIIKPLSSLSKLDYFHALIESLRLAFADSMHFVCDPEVVADVDVDELLNDVKFYRLNFILCRNIY